jgi:hypothetical protein
MLKLLSESAARNRIFHLISKYVPTRYILIKKGRMVASQARNLADNTLLT